MGVKNEFQDFKKSLFGKVCAPNIKKEISAVVIEAGSCHLAVQEPKFTLLLRGLAAQEEAEEKVEEEMDEEEPLQVAVDQKASCRL